MKATKAKEEWYAIRARPGSTRQASDSTRYTPDRLYETLLERNLRNGGFEVFMPSGKIEIKHHRTKKWIDKRFPLLPGYAFVNLPDHEFAKVESVEGVGRVLRVAWRPYRFTDETIAALRLADWEAAQNHDMNKARRIREEEISAKHLSRNQVKEMYPRGHKFTLSKSASFGAGFTARVLGPATQGRVKALIETLNGIVSTMDIPIEWVEDEAISPIDSNRKIA